MTIDELVAELTARLTPSQLQSYLTGGTEFEAVYSAIERCVEGLDVPTLRSLATASADRQSALSLRNDVQTTLLVEIGRAASAT